MNSSRRPSLRKKDMAGIVSSISNDCFGLYERLIGIWNPAVSNYDLIRFTRAFLVRTRERCDAVQLVLDAYLRDVAYYERVMEANGIKVTGTFPRRN